MIQDGCRADSPGGGAEPGRGLTGDAAAAAGGQERGGRAVERAVRLLRRQVRPGTWTYWGPGWTPHPVARGLLLLILWGGRVNTVCVASGFYWGRGFVGAIDSLVGRTIPPLPTTIIAIIFIIIIPFFAVLIFIAEKIECRCIDFSAFNGIRDLSSAFCFCVLFPYFPRYPSYLSSAKLPGVSSGHPSPSTPGLKPPPVLPAAAGGGDARTEVRDVVRGGRLRRPHRHVPRRGVGRGGAFLVAPLHAQVSPREWGEPGTVGTVSWERGYQFQVSQSEKLTVLQPLYSHPVPLATTLEYCHRSYSG